MNNQDFNVVAAPNKSKIQGKIVKIKYDIEGGTEVLHVKVEKSYDVEGMPNFTNLHIGKSIKILYSSRQ